MGVRIVAKPSAENQGICLASNVRVFVGDEELRDIEKIIIHPIEPDSILRATIQVAVSELDLGVEQDG